MDTRMYVMTHKKIEEISDKTYIPLHVGRAGKEDFGYLGDDTGENISYKNSSYCELTGMYWIWKNVKCDIVGICHYRRFFTREERILEKSYIDQTIEKYPIIVPNSRCVEIEDRNAYGHYANRHETKDLDLCREVIAEKYPEYVPAFDYAMNTIWVSIGNMWITRKDIYDRYCSWLFDVLFEVEKRIDTTGYDDYQKRVMGFLSERLFRVWLLMQPEAITEENVKQIEPSEFRNADKKVELISKYVKLKINPVLQLHKSGTMNESLAMPLQCKDDFDGKIPVWVCWWQGEAQMPEMARCCFESLRKNLPKEKTVLRVITLENCMEYLTFTESVIRKFNEGKISMTHLSDILRAELLYRYGGMYIDASIYVARPIPEDIFERNRIYTVKFESPIWSSDITKARWMAGLWCAPKGHKLFQLLMESLWYYWETEDKLVEYFLIDYIIAAIVEEFPEIRTELEECEYSSKAVYELKNYIDKKCTGERIKKLETESIFYSLNRRVNHQKVNIAGEQTVYGYIIENL